MSKKIYCICGIYLGEIATGSKLRPKIVHLCEGCNIKRISSDMMNKTKTPDVSGFDDIFGGFFGGKKL